MSIGCNNLYYESGKIKKHKSLYIEFPWTDCISLEDVVLGVNINKTWI